MKKLSLALESLEVTSFATVATGRHDRGTVRGASVEPASEDPQGCVQITGAAPNWCTGPECEVTLAISCVRDGCFSWEYETCATCSEACVLVLETGDC